MWLGLAATALTLIVFIVHATSAGPADASGLWNTLVPCGAVCGALGLAGLLGRASERA